MNSESNSDILVSSVVNSESNSDILIRNVVNSEWNSTQNESDSASLQTAHKTYFSDQIAKLFFEADCELFFEADCELKKRKVWTNRK